jgi:hypothetical protein
VRIAQHESDLESLRQEYQARQAHLVDLKRRREELKGQLRRIQTEIRAVNKGEALSTPSSLTTSLPGQSAGPQRLIDLLVEVMGQRTDPVTVKEFVKEVKRRRFRTKSRNIAAMVRTRIQELIAKGICRRAGDRRGFLLASSQSWPPATPAAGRVGKRRGRKGKRRRRAARRASADGRTQASLQSVLTDLLSRSPEPLPARELAAQVQAHGYVTRSRNFTNVLWVTLGKMDNVENVPGKGYRLKRR